MLKKRICRKCKTIQYILQYRYGIAQIKYRYGIAQIKYRYDIAQIKYRYDIAQIKKMVKCSFFLC